MSSSAGPLPVSSILRTLASAPQSHDKHQAARQLAAMDPKRFLANLQAFAATGSRQALAGLKTDMVQLEDIFYKLSRAGYDVSSAQRDFRMLQQFIAQFAISPERQTHQHHHRAGSFPTTPHPMQSSLPSPHAESAPRPIQPRHRSDSVVLPTPYSHPHTYSSSYSPSQSQFYQHTPPKNEGHASFPMAPSSSSPSSGSGSSRRSSTSSTSSASSQQMQMHVHPTQPMDIPSVSHHPHRLVKPRRMSAPLLQAMQPVQPTKKVHWASHATVYTFSTSAPTLMPSSRPSHAPRGPAQPQSY